MKPQYTLHSQGVSTQGAMYRKAALFVYGSFCIFPLENLRV